MQKFLFISNVQVTCNSLNVKCIYKKFAFHFFEDLLHYCMQYVGFEIIGTLRYQQKKKLETHKRNLVLHSN